MEALKIEKQNSIAAMQKELDFANSKYTELEGILRETETSSQCQISSLSMKLEDAHQLNQTFQSDMDKNKEHMDHLAKCLAQDLENAQNEVKVLEAKRISMDNSMRYSQSELNDANENYRKLEILLNAERESYQSETAKWKSLLEEKESFSHSLANAVDAAKEKIIELQDKIETAKAEHQVEFEASRSGLNLKLENAHASIKSLQIDFDAANFQLKEKEKALHEQTVNDLTMNSMLPWKQMTVYFLIRVIWIKNI